MPYKKITSRRPRPRTRARKAPKGFLRFNQRLKFKDPRALAVLGLVVVGGITAVLVSHAATGGSFTIGTSSDTYVDSANPDTNYGNITPLRASAANNRAFLRFQTGQAMPSGAIVTGAKLKLYIKTNRATSGGIEVHPEDGSWVGKTVTWNTQPVWSSTIYTTSTTPAAGTWLTINLPARAISASTPTSLGLRYTVVNAGVTFASREDTTHAPQLTVSYSSPTPTPSGSPTPTPVGTPSPTPTHTPTPTPTHTPTPTPTPSSSYACIHVWPSDNGRCGPYSNHPNITGIDGDPWVDQNVWTKDTNYYQTMHANSTSDWYITANANTNFGGVRTYAAIGWNESGTVDAGHSINSSWNVTIPTDTTKVAGWAAYDLWFNNWNDEVMIQTDITAPSANYNCDVVATPVFNGVPWHLCVFGSERVLAPGTDSFHDQNMPSGSVDILPMLKWLEQSGHLPAKSVWTAGSFGFEVCDTHRTDQIFRVSGFSWAAN